jgi:drug/metabolite transporter (DMT)-like permease
MLETRIAVDRYAMKQGILHALTAAVLFGVGTPLAKVLLGEVSPWMLAALLYLGSGLGLALYRTLGRKERVALQAREAGWLAAAIAAGGVAAPVLLMWGLQAMPAASASLLLNAEGVFTALFAWFVFRENFDRRIALGMASIAAGAVVLSWPARHEPAALLPAGAVLGACALWAIDNNLTRKVSLHDAQFIAMTKGLAAGTVNLVLARFAGDALPPPVLAASGAAVGFVSYGLSLVFFVLALRQLGTARTGAYFMLAPFAGALAATVFLREPVTVQLAIAAALMGIGVWLHLTEVHDHYHRHEALEHEHEHEHDEHHQHAHPFPVAAGTRHSHWHSHQPVTHRHPHYPDAHHLHRH